MKKRDPFPINEMDHKFDKIVIFSKQYKILEIRKCYSMALVFAFDIPEIVFLAHKLILEYVLKLKKFNFSSIQNRLSCQAEYPLKTNISVEKFNECDIE